MVKDVMNIEFTKPFSIEITNICTSGARYFSNVFIALIVLIVWFDYKIRDFQSNYKDSPLFFPTFPVKNAKRAAQQDRWKSPFGLKL